MNVARFTSLLLAVSGFARAAAVDFARDVKPLLDAHCTTCHGALKQKGRLRLDAGTLLLKGGREGEIVAPGDPAGSLLIDRLTTRDENERMPREGEPLAAAEIALLQRWIEEGAKIPEHEEIPARPEEHWFFQKPVKAPLPENSAFSNPIDCFLAADWARLGLAPQAPADRATLLRRVTLDLTGVPPTPEEYASPEPYEQAVERLLACPQYGVRWGRHFMDIWRYSDEVPGSCNAKETMLGEFHLWHWRDWIVDALNADKPYDRMIREMLAGDELAPNDPQVVAATGFIVRNYTTLGSRDLWLHDTVEHTSQAFLGLTVKCAKCHDHKYDPIPQTDYYRLRAIFEPIQKRIDLVPGTVDPLEAGIPRIFDADLGAVTRLFRNGNPQQPDEKTKIEPAAPALLRLAGLAVKEVPLPLEASHPGGRAFVRSDRIASVERALQQAGAEAERLAQKPGRSPGEEAAWHAAEARSAKEAAELAAVHASIAADDALAAAPAAEATRALAVAAREAQRGVARCEAASALADAVREREQAREKKDEGLIAAGEEKVKKAMEAQAKLATEQARPPGDYQSLWPSYSEHSTGRRLALAEWITRRDNPATARVLVNHVWLRHFGAPLVATVFDFGLHGARPLNPALLDWLAVDLMEHGWSLRHLHRLMVTSQAYRLSSAREPGGENEKRDPENHWLWRMNSQRMQAEQVRDSVLALAGKLDLTVGGPPLDPKQGDRLFRRSIYFRHTPGLADPLISVFDGADPNECYRRAESIVPQQALALANSRLLFEQARLIAGRCVAESPEAFLESAFQRVLGRSPNPQERAASLAFLAGAAASPEPALAEEKAPLIAASVDPALRRREQFVQVLLNHTDFVTIR